MVTPVHIHLVYTRLADIYLKQEKVRMRGGGRRGCCSHMGRGEEGGGGVAHIWGGGRREEGVLLTYGEGGRREEGVLLTYGEGGLLACEEMVTD